MSIKAGLSNPRVRDPALKLISDKLPDKLLKLKRFMNIMRGEEVDGATDDSGDDQERHVRVRRQSIGERRKQIREKAFERGSQTERNKHLLAVSLKLKHLTFINP